MRYPPRLCIALLIVLAICSAARAQEPVRRQWTIDGVAREALVYVPAGAKSVAAPVVFVFHGHGGRAGMMVRRVGMHRLWPEAIVVYPQGLPTPSPRVDPEGKAPGWQTRVGQLNDRDLKFFDAMLKDLRAEYKVDDRRVFSTGHSNGGFFTYILWAARGDQLAAVAPCAAACPAYLRPSLKPKPTLHLAGENDPLVRYALQAATIDAVRQLNQCGDGRPWEKQCTLYPSRAGAPLVTYIHPGAHELPREAPAVIAKFFKADGDPGDAGRAK